MQVLGSGKLSVGTGMSSFWPTVGAGTFSSGETSFSHLQITQTIYAPHISAKGAGQPYRGLGLKVKAIADNSVRSDLSSSERSVLRNFGSSSAKVNALAVDLDERIIAESLIDNRSVLISRLVSADLSEHDPRLSVRGIE
jgi:hypothetical protein